MGSTKDEDLKEQWCDFVIENGWFPELVRQKLISSIQVGISGSPVRSSYVLQLLFFGVEKVETLATGGTAPGIAIFLTVPFLFTYKPDVGVVDN